MNANFTADETGRLESVTFYPFDKNMPSLNLPDGFNAANVSDYVVRDGTAAREPCTRARSAYEKIESLKRSLRVTDYVAAKTVDALTDADSVESLLSALAQAKSEYGTVLGLREIWRREIRDLEKTMDSKTGEV